MRIREKRKPGHLGNCVGVKLVGTRFYPGGEVSKTIVILLVSWATKRVAFLPYFASSAANVAFVCCSHDTVGPYDYELCVRWVQTSPWSPSFKSKMTSACWVVLMPGCLARVLCPACIGILPSTRSHGLRRDHIIMRLVSRYHSPTSQSPKSHKSSRIACCNSERLTVIQDEKWCESWHIAATLEIPASEVGSASAVPATARTLLRRRVDERSWSLLSGGASHRQVGTPSDSTGSIAAGFVQPTVKNVLLFSGQPLASDLSYSGQFFKKQVTAEQLAVSSECADAVSSEHTRRNNVQSSLGFDQDRRVKLIQAPLQERTTTTAGVRKSALWR